MSDEPETPAPENPESESLEAESDNPQERAVKRHNNNLAYATGDATLATWRGKKIKVTDEELAQMLQKAGGYKSRVALQLGVSISAITHRIARSEYLREACKTIEDTLLDMGEASLIKKVQEGEGWAVTFFLKCKGRKRGWIERHDLAFGNGEFDVPPPPFVVEPFDSEYVEAERAKQAKAAAEMVDAFDVDATTSPLLDELMQTSGAVAQPLDGKQGNDPAVDTSGAGNGVQNALETPRSASQNEVGQTPTPKTEAPQTANNAQPVQPTPQPPAQRPLRPSEVEAMKRAKAEAERAASPQQTPRPSGRFVAVPAAFPVRR